MAQVKGLNKIFVKINNYTDKKLKRIQIAIMQTQSAVVKDARRIVPVITGNLQNSIAPGRVNVTSDEISGEVNANMIYASSVEKRKPYLFPSLLKNQRTLERFLEMALK